MALDQRDLQERLDAFIAATPCPGAALGLLEDGRITVVGSGVAHRGTGLAVRPETIFQIGSVTKVWTATLVMQLVDEGLVDLDAPVRRYLPGFALADEDVADATTVRHLLTHTSGIEGDVFDDVGSNDDALERYVTAMAKVGAVHGLGEAWSYCNSGFVLLGRIVEVLREQTWDDAVREHLSVPLGLGPVATRAAGAILHHAAVGHVAPPGTSTAVVSPMYDLPRGVGPAGAIVTSAGDLLRFGQLHIDGGVARSGTRVLSEESVRAMQAAQVPCPETELLADAWGLGWWVKESWGAAKLVGHGGNTVGQSAYFDLVPEQGVGVALLTNVTGASREAQDLVRGVLRDVAGVDAPPWTTVPEEPLEVDLDPYVGRWERYGFEFATEVVDGVLELEVRTSNPLAKDLGQDEPQRLPLTPVAPGVFLARDLKGDDPEPRLPVRFLGEGEPPPFLHLGARIARKVDA